MSTAEPGKATTRPRPALFRALGAAEPPAQVQIDGLTCQRLKVFKHDSWAATALYEGPRGQVVCKFHRKQSVGPVPMGWLGKLLARRETYILRKLADLVGVPRLHSRICVDGNRLPYAVGHEFVPGHPLGSGERVHDRFFTELETLLGELHRRNMAYVDLHKHENILVGDDGRPYLFDFQISLALPRRWPGNSVLLRKILKIFQASDLYHLKKNFARCRPDLAGNETDIAAHRPWWIRLHRLAAVPFRTARRRLLALLGIRGASGKATTEAFPEDAVQRELQQTSRAA